MVRLGYQSWDEFNRRFAAQRAIRALNPGLATWDDVRQFLADQGGAVGVEGFRAHRFIQSDPAGEPVSVETSVPVVKLSDGRYYLGQEHDGMPVAGPDGVKVESLGLNVPVVAELLRKLALSTVPTGAAHLRWPEDGSPAQVGATVGVLVLLRQTLRSEGSRWVEHGLELHCYHVDESGSCGEWTEGDRKSALVGLLNAIVRRDPHPDGPLLEYLVTCEAERIQALRVPTDEDRARNMRHTVIPLLAAVIST
jgi:hypothetical protein